MSHHWHEDDGYTALKQRTDAAQRERKTLIQTELAALSPEDRARVEKAQTLMEKFSESAEGQKLMEGCWGWNDYKADLWKNPHMAVQLLILSGGLKALTQENVPA